jgi:hypothetical protein
MKKRLASMFGFFLGVFGAAHGSAPIDPSSVEVKKIQPQDQTVLEEWTRITEEEDILGISAAKLARPKWQWQIFVNVAEFIRNEPLESKFRKIVTESLRTVKGVEAVTQEDREVWLVEGASANGGDLVRACAVGLSTIEAELRKAYDSPPRN